MRATAIQIVLGVVVDLPEAPRSLELEQAKLRRQAAATAIDPETRVTRTPIDVVNEYLATTFSDLDPDDIQLVHAAVNTALKDAE